MSFSITRPITPPIPFACTLDGKLVNVIATHSIHGWPEAWIDENGNAVNLFAWNRVVLPDGSERVVPSNILKPA